MEREPGLVAVTKAQKANDLAYAEISSSATVPTSLGDIAGLSITFTPDSSSFWLEAFFPRITKDASASYVWMQIHTSGNTLLEEAVDSIPASGWTSQTIKYRVTGATPGTAVTYKVRGITGAGVTTITASNVAGAGERPFIRAYRA